MSRQHLTRRGFLLSLSAAGAAVGLGLGIQPAAHAGVPAIAGAVLTPSVFVGLAKDGTVTIRCYRAEMGQGIRATLPWIIAGELGADYDRVVVEQATGDAVYGNQNTDGSTSIRGQLPMLREVGAAARVMLIAAAAAQWGVSPDGLVAADHAVTDPASGQSLSFGALAEAAAQQAVPESPPLRPRMAHLDKPMPLTDARDIVTGAAVFGADKVLPGMQFAVIARPPDEGATVAALDDRAARAVPGVIDIVAMPARRGAPGFKLLGGVAVVASNTWAAMEGRRALQITWKHSDNAESNSTDDLAAMRASVDHSGRERRAVGNADRALEAAAETHTARYQIPHMAHAPMEPPAAVAWCQAEHCEVWAPVQAPQRTRGLVADIVDMKEEHVTIHQTLLGGGFGRKSKPDFATEAAYISSITGTPIRLQWDRTDDVRHSYYHASSVQRLDAGMDATGKLTAWRHRVSSPPILGTFLPPIKRLSGLEMGQGMLDLALDVPNVCMESLSAPVRIRIGWMRSVYNINHGFAIQSFIDELAHKKGVSTPEMLKTVLGPPRLLTKKEAGARIPNYGSDLDERPVDVGRWHGVIDEIVARSGYRQGLDEQGRGMGFAAHASFNSYTAAVVAIVRDSSGRPRVDEAWITIDAGQLMNLDRVRAQLEGAVIFGASIALHSEITFRDGAVEQSNFHDYKVLRMDEAPRAIHVSLIASDALPGGVGEPGVPPVAPAIANGWFALTGERARTLPIRPA